MDIHKNWDYAEVSNYVFLPKKVKGPTREF